MNFATGRSVALEIFKNALMGQRWIRGLRSRISAGRTTGALDVDASISHVLGIYDQYVAGLADIGLDSDFLEGRAILEIGPGAHLGVELKFLGAGAREVYAVDRFTDLQNPAWQRSIYQGLIELMEPRERERCEGALLEGDGTCVLSPEKIKYWGGRALEDSLERPAQFDLVVSHQALEHTADLERSTASISRLLKPGGYCVHICNLRSLGGVYRFEEEPLALLRPSPRLWKWMFSNRGGSNRARASEYKRLFAENALEIRNFEVLDRMSDGEVEDYRPHLHLHYRELPTDDLAILRFRVVAQRR